MRSRWPASPSTMPTPGPVTPSRRCAVYTRKSTDEGLDQEYNSLEAQRDAGRAFIASQRHEGWVVYHPFCKFRLAPLAGSARRSV